MRVFRSCGGGGGAGLSGSIGGELWCACVLGAGHRRISLVGWLENRIVGREDLIRS